MFNFLKPQVSGAPTPGRFPCEPSSVRNLVPDPVISANCFCTETSLVFAQKQVWSLRNNSRSGESRCATLRPGRPGLFFSPCPRTEAPVCPRLAASVSLPLAPCTSVQAYVHCRVSQLVGSTSRYSFHTKAFSVETNSHAGSRVTEHPPPRL